MDLYGEIILDHFKNPRHEGSLNRADITGEDTNPLCGDRMKIWLKIDDRKIICDIGFLAEGCAISKAAMSILSDKIIGKSLNYIEKFSEKDIYKLLNIEISPARVKCALLGLVTIKKAIKLSKILNKQSNNAGKKKQ